VKNFLPQIKEANRKLEEEVKKSSDSTSSPKIEAMVELIEKSDQCGDDDVTSLSGSENDESEETGNDKEAIIMVNFRWNIANVVLITVMFQNLALYEYESDSDGEENHGKLAEIGKSLMQEPNDILRMKKSLNDQDLATEKSQKLTSDEKKSILHP